VENATCVIVDGPYSDFLQEEEIGLCVVFLADDDGEPIFGKEHCHSYQRAVERGRTIAAAHNLELVIDASR